MKMVGLRLRTRNKIGEKSKFLSDTGRSLLGIGVEVHQTIEQKLEECLGHDEYQILNRLLGQAVECLSKN
jgi:hypothetical protein